MICSIKAQALASGEVASVTIIHRDTDAAGQLEDIRTLIADGVDAIIVNPADPDALNPAHQGGDRQGHRGRRGRLAGHRANRLQPLQRPGELRLPRRQVAVRAARRARATSSTCAASPACIRPTPTATRASSGRSPSNPGIKVVSETFTNWDQATGTQQITDLLNAGTQIDGVWTSGIDNVDRRRLQDGRRALRAHRRRGQQRLRQPAARHAPTIPASSAPRSPTPAPSVAPVSRWRSRSSTARSPAEQDHAADARRSGTTSSDAGKAALAAANDPSLEPAIWPLGLQHPRLDHLHQGPAPRLQGPGRVDPTLDGHRGVPAVRHPSNHIAGTDHMTDLLLEATGVAKRYGARGRAARCLAGRATRARSTPCWAPTVPARARWSRSSPAPSGPMPARIAIRGTSAPIHSPADARRAGMVSVYQDPSLIPDLDIADNLRLTDTPVAAVPRLAGTSWVSPDLDLSETTRATCRCRRCASSTWRAPWPTNPTSCCWTRRPRRCLRT